MSLILCLGPCHWLCPLLLKVLLVGIKRCAAMAIFLAMSGAVLSSSTARQPPLGSIPFEQRELDVEAFYPG